MNGIFMNEWLHLQPLLLLFSSENAIIQVLCVLLWNDVGGADAAGGGGGDGALITLVLLIFSSIHLRLSHNSSAAVPNT